MNILSVTAGAVLALLPSAVQAQSAAGDAAPPAAVTVSGSAAIVSDYRFRGVSQSDRGLAVQGGITVYDVTNAFVPPVGICEFVRFLSGSNDLYHLIAGN